MLPKNITPSVTVIVFIKVLLYQDLSYGEIFGWQTWSLACEQNMFYMHAITKLQKGPHI